MCAALETRTATDGTGEEETKVRACVRACARRPRWLLPGYGRHDDAFRKTRLFVAIGPGTRANDGGRPDRITGAARDHTRFRRENRPNGKRRRTLINTSETHNVQENTVVGGDASAGTILIQGTICCHRYSGRRVVAHLSLRRNSARTRRHAARSPICLSFVQPQLRWPMGLLVHTLKCDVRKK